MSRGLMVAASRSGSGKTVVTLGLMRALRRRGLAVAGLKNGPDYIDPAFHAAATGRPSRNIDTWAMSPDLAACLGERAQEHADLVVCEGSMGLFDGVPAPAGRSGSSADTAALLGLPVLLVHDCSGQSQSAAALLQGCRLYDQRLAIAGVVLNRIGSERHRRLVTEAVEAIGLPVLGALPRQASLSLPERHLGLVQAGETADLDARLDGFADLVEEHIDLERLLASASALLPCAAGEGDHAQHGGGGTRASLNSEDAPSRSLDLAATPLHHASRGPPPPARCASSSGGGYLPPPGQRIAVARDSAFSFLYPHVLEGWRAAGAELLFFSPLADEAPSPDADGCWLPGGYPELHAGRLGANTRFLDGLRGFARTRPVHGECGGYMVLGHTLTDADGITHPMAGLLGVETSFATRRMTLGYRDATLAHACALGPKGARLRGHEFHYATVANRGGDEPFAQVTDAYGADPAPSGSRRGNVTGSFFHALARV